MSKKIEAQKKDTDMFNNFALSYKDFEWNPYFISDREGKIYMNPKFKGTSEQVMQAYKSYLNRK